MFRFIYSSKFYQFSRQFSDKQKKTASHFNFPVTEEDKKPFQVLGSKDVSNEFNEKLDLATEPVNVKNIFSGLREQQSNVDTNNSKASDSDIDPFIQNEIKKLQKNVKSKSLWIPDNFNSGDSLRTNEELAPPVLNVGSKVNIMNTFDGISSRDMKIVKKTPILFPKTSTDSTQPSTTIFPLEKEQFLNYNNVLENRKNAVKILSEIPGPSLLKHLSNIWNIIPFIGSQLSLNWYKTLLDIGMQNFFSF